MKAPAPPKRDPFPKGTHTAICYAVVDFGTQKTTYMDEAKLTHQIKIQWEVPALRFEGKNDDGTEYDKPKVIGQTYTFSIGDKAKLNHLLTAWGIEDLPNFDFRELLGKNCLLNVIHKTAKTSGNIYSIISTIMEIPGGTAPLQPENPLMYYSIEEDGFDIPEGVYEWMRKIIADSEEHKGKVRGDNRSADEPPLEDTRDWDSGDPDDPPF